MNNAETRQTRISTFTNCSRICILINMHASVRGSYTKWYVKVGGHYWHQILLSVFLWAKSTTREVEPWRKLFAICHLFRSRVERTDEVKFDFLPSCANIDVSRTPLSVPSGERERKVKGRRRKAARQCFSVLTHRVFTNFWHGKYWHCILLRFSRVPSKVSRKMFLRVCVKYVKILRDTVFKMKVANIVGAISFQIYRRHIRILNYTCWHIYG